MMDIYLAPMELIYEATHWYGALFPCSGFKLKGGTYMSDKKTSKDAEREFTGACIL